MSAQLAIDMAEASGIAIAVRNGNLVLRCPEPEGPEDDFLTMVREHKAEIISLLAPRQPAPPYECDRQPPLDGWNGDRIHLTASHVETLLLAFHLDWPALESELLDLDASAEYLCGFGDVYGRLANPDVRPRTVQAPQEATPASLRYHGFAVMGPRRG